MIKTGINFSSLISPELIRLLVGHPDVDLRWVAGSSMPSEGVGAVFDQLQGEVGKIAVVPDYKAIDLYIGHDIPGLADFLGSDPRKRAILLGPMLNISGYEGAVPGICEYYRKPLVRGAQLAVQPDVPTLLGALALMPLAKNLLLNSTISGVMMLPRHSLRGVGDFRIPATTMSPLEFKPLREQILLPLQASFNSPIEINAVEMRYSYTACAILTLDIKLDLNDVRKLYTDFYGDHRHIVFPTHAVNEAMVEGTNKTVIGLGKDGLGRLVVTAAFDVRYKAGAGNIVHLMNLLFGLDELAGF